MCRQKTDRQTGRQHAHCIVHAVIVLEVLTAESYTVIICQQSYSSIIHSLFHPRLKTFLFCKSFPPQPFLFFSRIHYMDSTNSKPSFSANPSHYSLSSSSSALTTWIPQTFTVTSQHIPSFTFLVFLFYTF